MKNCMILGSGRSGTSMTAGVLSSSGYFMGEELYGGDEGNRKGYFEDVEINSINEDILARILPERPAGIVGKVFFKERMTRGQRWLSEVPTGAAITSAPEIDARIRKQVSKTPYCFKDPRFCYTLPAWRPYLTDTVFVCVFRHPGDTADSILKQCAREEYLKDFPIDFAKALRVWRLMYEHILKTHHVKDEPWVFLHYNQFLDGTAFERLESALGAVPDRTFVDAALRRSKAKGEAPQEALSVYRTLCTLSGYEEKGE